VIGDQVRRPWWSVDERGEGVHRGEDEKDMAGRLGARAAGHEEVSGDASSAPEGAS